MTTQPQSGGAALRITPRERQALQLLASGQTTTGVAAGLGMATLDVLSASRQSILPTRFARNRIEPLTQLLHL